MFRSSWSATALSCNGPNTWRDRCRPQPGECLSLRGTHKNKNIWLTLARGFAVVGGLIGGEQSGRGTRSQERWEGVLASFFVGAASASNAGFCLLDKVICSPTTPSPSRFSLLVFAPYSDLLLARTLWGDGLIERKSCVSISPLRPLWMLYRVLTSHYLSMHQSRRMVDSKAGLVWKALESLMS